MLMVMVDCGDCAVVMAPEELDQSPNLFQKRNQAGLVNLTTFPNHLRAIKNYSITNENENNNFSKQ